LELAELGIRATPEPHPILVIRDDDPKNYGNWSLAPGRQIPVQPGDRLTIEWQTAHSIGASGPGQAGYERLPPGSYWFRVVAVKANGAPTGQEASLPLEVVVPVHLRLEFWLVLAALTGSGAAWLGRWALKRRMQQQIARLEQETALERERARIARDLHDEIGAGLTEIAMQSDWVRRDLAAANLPDTQRRIESVCESAVSLVRNVDEIVWAVNPANDTIERFVNYLAQSSEQFLEAAGVRVRFGIPEQLPAGTLTGVQRHCLFLAVREALNNAVKHARADLVRLEIQVDAARLRICVEDNGCGFEPEATGREGIHEGLENMRRRLEEIGGRFLLTSRPGGGTRVEFQVPLAR
jgi:signal transduction histidine kinase